MLGVRVAEGNMTAGKLFILQDQAANILDSNIRADGKLSDTVGIFVAMRIFQKFFEKFFVLAFAFGDAGIFDESSVELTGNIAILGNKDNRRQLHRLHKLRSHLPDMSALHRPEDCPTSLVR